MKNTQLPANLFFDLATLISAGISISEAAKRVYSTYPSISEWTIAISALDSGRRLSQALFTAKLITRFQSELISVSEDAGRLQQALKRLAVDVENKNRRNSQLKSKLLYPLAILVVGILVSSILSLVQNPDMSLIVMFSLLVVKLLFAFWIFKTILRLSQLGSDYWLSKLDSYQNQSWYRKHFSELLFEVLYWHSSSGIDPKTSFSRISKLIASPTIKKKLIKVSTQCGQGVSISSAIRQAELPLPSNDLQVFSTGEHAGDIEGTLKKLLENIQFETNLTIDSLIEWIPRMFYGIVVVYAIIALV